MIPKAELFLRYLGEFDNIAYIHLFRSATRYRTYYIPNESDLEASLTSHPPEIGLFMNT